MEDSIKKSKRTEVFQKLPEGCIAAILSGTTPIDARRLSLVSKTFCSAAESDTVWEHFIPSDSQFISLSRSLLNTPTIKALYLALSDIPITIDNGRKIIQLDRKSGKKCCMIAARALTDPLHPHTELYWNWTSMSESRFLEVAILLRKWLLEFQGMINTLVLSPNTRYAAYLVFKVINVIGLRNFSMKLSVGVKGGRSSTKFATLDSDEREISLRSDGWLENEMGEFFYSYLQDEEIYMSFRGIDYTRCLNFFLEGIEVRPK